MFVQQLRRTNFMEIARALALGVQPPLVRAQTLPGTYFLICSSEIRDGRNIWVSVVYLQNDWLLCF